MCVPQILAHVLEVPPNKHNGTWSNVRGLLEGDPGGAGGLGGPGGLLTLLLCGLLALGALH